MVKASAAGQMGGGESVLLLPSPSHLLCCSALLLGIREGNHLSLFCSGQTPQDSLSSLFISPTVSLKYLKFSQVISVTLGD